MTCHMLALISYGFYVEVSLFVKAQHVSQKEYNRRRRNLPAVLEQKSFWRSKKTFFFLSYLFLFPFWGEKKRGLQRIKSFVISSYIISQAAAAFYLLFYLQTRLRLRRCRLWGVRLRQWQCPRLETLLPCPSETSCCILTWSLRSPSLFWCSSTSLCSVVQTKTFIFIFSTADNCNKYIFRKDIRLEGHHSTLVCTSTQFFHEWLPILSATFVPKSFICYIAQCKVKNDLNSTIHLSHWKTTLWLRCRRHKYTKSHQGLGFMADGPTT